MVSCYTNVMCSNVNTTCIKTLIINLPCTRYYQLSDMLNNETGAGHIKWTVDSGEFVYASSTRIKNPRFDYEVSNALLSMEKTCDGIKLVYRPIDCTKDMVIGEIVVRPVTPVDGTDFFFRTNPQYDKGFVVL